MQASAAATVLTAHVARSAAALQSVYATAQELAGTPLPSDAGDWGSQVSGTLSAILAGLDAGDRSALRGAAVVPFAGYATAAPALLIAVRAAREAAVGPANKGRYRKLLIAAWAGPRSLPWFAAKLVEA